MAGTDTEDRALGDLLDALAAVGESRSLATGEELCREGEPSDGAFVVVSGRVAAMVAGYEGEVAVATHGAGSIVGEVTTLIGGLRTASLVAVEPTAVSIVHRERLRTVLDEHRGAATTLMHRARERTDRSRVAALLSQELQAPDGAAVAAIAERVTWTDLRAGEVLFRRGDPADAAYLVVSGRLGITDLGADRPADLDRGLPDDADDDAGHEGDAESVGEQRLRSRPTRVIEIGRGAVVGEFGLLEDRARAATVVALRDSSLARLSAQDFRSITEDHTALAMGLVRRILDRGGDTDAHRIARTFAVAVTAGLDPTERDDLVGAMCVALLHCGPTMVLDPERIDHDLNQPGIADTPSGEFGEVRLAELLHQAETDASHLVFDTGHQRTNGTFRDPTPNWTHRCLRSADQVVIVCSPAPAADEAAEIDRLVELVPDRIPIWLAVHHPRTNRRPRRSAELRRRFRVDEVHHVRAGNADDASRLGRLAAGRGVGLVLSGGGARGHAHVGVFRALTENGVPIDRVVGASMGSIVGAGICQGLTPAELLRDIRRGADDLLDYTVPLVSLIKGERIVTVLERQFDRWDIDDLWIPFACPSTDLTNARVVVHRDGPVARAIRASIAIPGVLPPVVDGDVLLADGGVLENLPVGVLADDPSIDVIVASDVAPPSGPSANDDYGLAVSGWTELRSRWLPGFLGGSDPSGAPGIGGTLMRAMLIGSSKSRDEHLASGVVDLYLDLDVTDVNILDFGQVDIAAARGYESSLERVANWLARRGGSVWER